MATELLLKRKRTKKIKLDIFFDPYRNQPDFSRARINGLLASLFLVDDFSIGEGETWESKKMEYSRKKSVEWFHPIAEKLLSYLRILLEKK